MDLSLISSNSRELMALVIIGKFKCGDTFEVYVCPPDNRMVPHIHVIAYEGTYDKIKFQSAIRLDKPEYFPHEGKHEDVFNAKQLKAFVAFINKVRLSNNRRVMDMTNYEFCCLMWNNNDSRKKIHTKYTESDKPSIPNYSELNQVMFKSK